MYSVLSLEFNCTSLKFVCFFGSFFLIKKIEKKIKKLFPNSWKGREKERDGTAAAAAADGGGNGIFFVSNCSNRGRKGPPFLFGGNYFNSGKQIVKIGRL